MSDPTKNYRPDDVNQEDVEELAMLEEIEEEEDINDWWDEDNEPDIDLKQEYEGLYGSDDNSDNKII